MTQPEPQVAEESLTSQVLAALTAWLALVLPAVLAIVGVPDLSAILRFEQFWTRQVDRLMPEFASLARQGWERTARELGVDLPFDPRDPELVELLSHVRNLLVRVPDETYRQVIKSLEIGRDKGESQTQLARRISNVLDINGSENWPNRARVIARTEVNRFTEAGGLAAARHVELAERSVILKQWQDRDDDRVRRTHARVDNQLRRLGEAFQVGRSRLQHPVDPAGFAADVVNCRCVLHYVRVGGR